ncbi:MAG: FAD-dependent thymidylate synthase [Mogibacterium sp.]|nr:FAD-dependent thymidylate synthase [Mogibacterium sp.]
MLKVELLYHTPEPEKAIALSARLCYASTSISELEEGLTKEKTDSFVHMLSDIGHESPIEHASFTFGIEGVSRSLLAQITRHRIASFSVQSQRYVREDGFEFVTPPQIAADPEALEIFEQAMRVDNEYYERIAAVLKKNHTARLVSEGMDEAAAAKKAEKMAIEDARFVLPNACTTKMIVTMNARSLNNFFAHRCCNRAQWEIRELAEQMLRLVRGVAPVLFEKSGPPCLRGACPEGKMTCGKAAQMREYYKDLV